MHVFNTMIIYRDMGNSAHTHNYTYTEDRKRVYLVWWWGASRLAPVELWGQESVLSVVCLTADTLTRITHLQKSIQ